MLSPRSTFAGDIKVFSQCRSLAEVTALKRPAKASPAGTGAFQEMASSSLIRAALRESKFMRDKLAADSNLRTTLAKRKKSDCDKDVGDDVSVTELPLTRALPLSLTGSTNVKVDHR